MGSPCDQSQRKSFHALLEKCGKSTSGELKDLCLLAGKKAPDNNWGRYIRCRLWETLRNTLIGEGKAVETMDMVIGQPDTPYVRPAFRENKHLSVAHDLAAIWDGVWRMKPLGKRQQTVKALIQKHPAICYRIRESSTSWKRKAYWILAQDYRAVAELYDQQEEKHLAADAYWQAWLMSLLTAKCSEDAGISEITRNREIREECQPWVERDLRNWRNEHLAERERTERRITYAGELLQKSKTHNYGEIASQIWQAYNKIICHRYHASLSQARGDILQYHRRGTAGYNSTPYIEAWNFVWSRGSDSRGRLSREDERLWKTCRSLIRESTDDPCYPLRFYARLDLDLFPAAARERLSRRAISNWFGTHSMETMSMPMINHLQSPQSRRWLAKRCERDLAQTRSRLRQELWQGEVARSARILESYEHVGHLHHTEMMLSHAEESWKASIPAELPPIHQEYKSLIQLTSQLGNIANFCLSGSQIFRELELTQTVPRTEKSIARLSRHTILFWAKALQEHMEML
jgi:hypothetical protein